MSNLLQQNNDLNHVIDQYFNDDDISLFPKLDSDYYDVDSLKKNNKNLPIKFSDCKYSILHLNIRSIPDKFTKLELLLTDLQADDITFDIILLCETFLSEKNKDMYKLPGYRYVGKQRQHHKCGGVGIFVKKSLSFKPRDDLSVFIECEFESVFIEIFNGKEHTIVGEVYRVPGTDCRASIANYESIITQVNNEHKNIVIGTDQNINLLNTEHPYTREMLNMFYSMEMIPTITRPTRVTHTSATLIDNVYVKTKHLDQIASGILTSDLSDHFAVFTLLGKKDSSTSQPDVVEHRKIDDKTVNHMRNLLMATDWSFMTNLPTSSQYDAFVSKFSEYLDLCAPVQSVRISPKYAMRNKWMSRGLLTSSRRVTKMRKQASGRDVNDVIVLRYKRYRNLYNRLIRISRQLHYQKLFDYHKGNISGIWRTLNDITRRSNDKSTCITLNINNRLTSDKKEISDGFCNYFTSIGNLYGKQVGKPTIPFTGYLGKENEHSMFFSPIDPGDIIHIFGDMKSKKSTGHDDITSNLLKQLKGELAYPLSIIVNSSLQSGIVPDSMKLARILPLYKSKDHQLLVNYRPISLLPVFSKILEKVVYKKLIGFLDMHKIIYKSQYGFRTNHSTIHAVTEFVNNATNSCENGEHTLGVFLDLSKAFDCINHDILIRKLYHYGIRGSVLEWFRSYIKNRKHYVSFMNMKSEVMNIEDGVPQGSVLGPLLFLLYINDLPSCIQHSKVILFADDTTIYSSSQDLKNLHNNVNLDLVHLVDWFRANKLSLNASKSDYILIKHNRQNSNGYEIRIDGITIDKKTCCKFLGIHIDDKLVWTDHLLHTQSKMSKSMYALNRCKHLVPRPYMKTLYDTLIHPYLMYGISLWGGSYKTNLNPLRIIQKKAMRCIHNVNYNAHTSSLFNESRVLRLDELYRHELGKLMYNVYHHINIPSPLIELYHPTSTVHFHNTRQRGHFHVKHRKTMKSSNSILHKGPLIWSLIPNSIKSCPSLKLFKSNYKTFLVKGSMSN